MEGVGATTLDSAGTRMCPKPGPFGSPMVGVPGVLSIPEELEPLTRFARRPGRLGEEEPARASSPSPYSRFHASMPPTSTMGTFLRILRNDVS